MKGIVVIVIIGLLIGGLGYNAYRNEQKQGHREARIIATIVADIHRDVRADSLVTLFREPKTHVRKPGESVVPIPETWFAMYRTRDQRHISKQYVIINDVVSVVQH